MAKSGMSDSDVEAEDPQKTTEVAEASGARSACSGPVCVIAKPLKPSTPISIIIQALVKNLCSVYEHDEKKTRELYNLICDKLYERTIIDESYSMVEFEGVRSQYQSAFHQLLSSARGDEAAVPIHPFWPGNDIAGEWSHYYREFDEVAYIAGGGFGKVYRVKHKLDGTEYAIKKIFIRSDGIKSVMNYLSEVKTFASLNHSNIVQYKAAWLELGAPSGKHSVQTRDYDSETSTSDESDYETQKTSHVDTYIYPEVMDQVESVFQTKSDSSDFRVTFEQSRHHSYSTVEKKPVRTKKSSISEGGNAICTVEEIRRLQAKPHPRWATLFIQMSLCQGTLKQWLETRNSTESMEQNEAALVPVVNHGRITTVMEILRQLLKGLEYIHWKGIVHHDIKPSNIFMQLENGSLLVQLGDFGLACPLQSTRHCLAFGTKLYAAPEQLSGKCDPKSDMYSLGIVLLELTETFQTDMERVHNITELRKGHLPPSLPVQQPQLAHIISQLVVRNPGTRPNAATLLKLISVNAVESDVVRDLQVKIAEKDEEINKLKELLKMAGINGL